MVPKDHPLIPRILDLLPIAGLEDWLKEEVVAQGELLQFKKRATVFKEGDDDPYAIFLVAGKIELRAGDHTPIELIAGLGDGVRALSQLRPRRYTARCESDVTVFRIKRAMLDHILSEEQVSKEGPVVVTDGIEVEETEDEPTDWMSRLLESELFTRLPPDHMARFFAELEPFQAAAGENIVEQGTPGDYLYIVAEGECCVVRKARGSSQEHELARLGFGDVFGEEALIAEAPRNATVRAVVDSLMMRLPKASFEELVSKPVLRPVPYGEAEQLVAAGAVWLDVRFPEEFQADALPDALNVPLGLLRVELAKLDRGRTYITCCDTGGRASTAAFLMMRERFDVYYLAGGLQHTPVGSENRAAASEATEIEFELDTIDTASFTPAPQAPAPQPAAAAAVPADNDDAAPAAALSALEASNAALNAELEALRAQLNDERGRHERATQALGEELAQIRTARDAQASRANKAVSAARELKQRGERAVLALNNERAQLARARDAQIRVEAEAKRALEMERLRFSKEIETAQGRLEAARSEWDDTLSQERKEASRAIEALESRLSESHNAIESARAAQEARETQAREDLETEQARVAVLEAEGATARSRIEVLEARFEATRRTIVEQETQLQDAVRRAADQQHDDEEALQEQREALALARAEAESERRKLEQSIAAVQVEHEQQRRELDQQHERLTEEREALAERERASAAEFAQRQRDFEERVAHREEALAEAEAALRDEEAQWQSRVAEAVKDEHAKLERELAEVDQAMSAFDVERNTALEQMAEREAGLQQERDALDEERKRFEAERSAARAEAQSAVDALLEREHALEQAEAVLERQREGDLQKHRDALTRLAERARGEMAQLKSAYERKLQEQAALLADERRRLENQTVRLNEALARQAPPPPPPPPAAPPPTPAAPADPDIPVLEIDGVVQDPNRDPAPPDDDPERAERDRVMSPQQIKELRRRMQQKVAAMKQQ